MGTWRRCTRKWYLGHYRRLKPRTKEHAAGQPLVIGNWVHDSLAAYYDPDVRADPVEYGRMLLHARQEEAPEWAADAEKDWKLVEAMLSGYLEWLSDTGADADLEIEGSEIFAEALLTKTEYGEVTLLSKLDAPVRLKSSGARLALEHKTTQSLDAPLDVMKLDTQFLTEHLVRFQAAINDDLTPEAAYDKCQGVLLNQLRKVKRTAAAKPPFYGREIVPHNIHELRNHWRHVVAYARQVQEAHARLDAGESHQTVCPPSPRRDCTWDCEFFKVCVMADDGSDFEGALDSMYEEHDPLERYEGSTPLGG
jgi:hypothetical protein